jgi:hypothetical protein
MFFSPKNKSKWTAPIVGVVLASTVLFAGSFYLPAAAQNSPTDAIAIRVIPNPKHFGPGRWYREQNFKGSPQEMVVDGYDAIRDGNIVYVNAANIADNKFYTNIYAISFNLGADNATNDIFGQILQFWKFNNNLMTGNNAGHCINTENNISECFKANGELQFLKYTAEDDEPNHLVPTIESEGDNKVYAISNYMNLMSPQMTSIDVNKKYYLSGKFKSVGTPASVIYFGYAPYDANKSGISAWQILRGGTAGTISSFTNNQIKTAETISGWNGPGTMSLYRNIGIYYSGDTTHLPNYIFYKLPTGINGGYGPSADGLCSMVGDWTPAYYCTSPSYGAYSTASGDTVALNLSLPPSVAGQIIPGQTKIMNHWSGGSYIYAAASGVTLNNQWQTFKVAITGSDFNSYSKFWPDTRFAKILILANYNYNNTTHTYNVPTTKLLLDDITFATEECLNVTGNSSDDAVQSAYEEFDKANASCQSATDCGEGQYCTSIKAAAIRDTRRLADLAELNTSLANYRFSHNKTCPALAQGSYVPNHSISTWPSWQGTIGRNLGRLMPVDPINKLGKCGSETTVNANAYSASSLGCTGGVSGTSVYSFCNGSWTYNIYAPLDSNYEAFAVTSNTSAGPNGEDLSTYPINQVNRCRSEEGFNHRIDIYVDNETTPRGFICNGASLPTNPQYGKVQIGHLSQGNHQIRFSWSNDWNQIPSGQTVLFDSNVQIYRLGVTSADSFDPATCWDARRKIFSKPVVPAPPYVMELPQNSWAYTYVADKDGRKCAVNARLESNYNNLANAGCVDGGSQSCPNNPVTATGDIPDPADVLSIDCSNITAYPGSAVSSFLKIKPKSNTTISNVTLSGMAGTWNTALPAISQYQSGLYWQIKSPTGGITPSTPGNYAFKLNVTDSTGATTQKDCSIKLLNSYIVISPINNPAPVMQGHSLSQLKVKAAVKNLNLAPISFMFTVKDPATGEVLNDNHTPNQGFYSGAGIATGWVQGSNLGSTDQREYYRNFPSGEVIAYAGPNGGTGKDYIVEVQARDVANNTAFTSFLVHVYNAPPTGSPQNITLTASTGKQVSAKILDANDDQSNFDLSKVSLTGQTFSNNSTIPDGLTDNTSSNNLVANAKIYSYVFTGQLANSNVFNVVSQAYNLVLRIKDRFDVWRNFNFTVTVQNEKLAIDYAGCPDQAIRFTDPNVTCQLKIKDSDGNKIKDIIVSDNTGLTQLTSKIGVNLPSGATSDFSFNPGNNRNYTIPPDHPVKFSAMDEFGLVNDQTVWNLRINNYCGDNIKDTPNTEGAGGPNNDGQEDCDAPSGSQPATAANGLAANPAASGLQPGGWTKQYECSGQCTDKSNCAGTCKYAGGFCGDNDRQENHGEGCDGTDNISTGPTIRSGSSETKQYQCATGTCVPSGGWCGDSQIQNGSGNFNAGENCDKGNWTKSPAASNADNQYLCNSDCKQYGGYCGDKALQASQGEQCDPTIESETEKCTLLSAYGVKDSDDSALDCTNLNANIIGSTGIKSLYSALCQANCSWPASNSQCGISKSSLGVGCYIGQLWGQASTDVVGCQKGVWSCNNGSIMCDDIFSQKDENGQIIMQNGEPLGAKWDYCCKGDVDKVKNDQIGPFLLVRATADDLIVPSFVGTYTNVGNVFNYYTCDNVCKKTGKVCVGVGLTNTAVSSCLSIIHDDANNCSKAGNSVEDNCKSLYSLAGASTALNSIWWAQYGHSKFAGYVNTCKEQGTIPAVYFNVGETGCYCQ